MNEDVIYPMMPDRFASDTAEHAGIAGMLLGSPLRDGGGWRPWKYTHRLIQSTMQACSVRNLRCLMRQPHGLARAAFSGAWRGELFVFDVSRAMALVRHNAYDQDNMWITCRLSR